MGWRRKRTETLTYAQRAPWMIGGFSKRLRGWPLPCPRNRSSVIRRYRSLGKFMRFAEPFSRAGLILKVEKIR
jgi:hypothetical protein